MTAVEMDGEIVICDNGADITGVIEAETEFETLSTAVAIDAGFVPDNA